MTEQLGKYIVLEGLDGLGKTTQVQRLAAQIGAKAIREPGGGIIGEALRTILINPAMQRVNPMTDVLLHAAQRSEQAQSDIRPALAKGQNVVSDRSWYSSAAYQGAQGVNSRAISLINDYALRELIKPDIFILLDADPAVGVTRSSRGDEYYKAKGIDFLQSVRNNYLQLSRDYDGHVIDAAKPPGEVNLEILAIVQERLNR